MHSVRSMVVFVCAFALGIAWAALSSYFFLLSVTFGFCVLSYRFRVSSGFFVVLAVFFVLGFFRYQFAITSFESLPLFSFQDDAPHAVVGVVKDYPDVREDHIKLIISVDTVDGVASGGKLLLRLPRYPDDYFYGDRLEFVGVMEAPIEFLDFSYKNYLRRYGISSVVYEPRISEWVRGAEFSFWRSWIFLLKDSVLSRLNRLLVEPEASFAAGILLGARSGIPDDILEDFKTTGLTHLLAISGYNITLIISFTCGLFAFLRPRAKILVATSVIFVFVVMVGASAAVVRAALMGSLALFARWFGRTADITRLLMLSALAMMILNPFILIDDVGFQLSFLATFGLIHLSPYVESFAEQFFVFRKIPSVFSWKEAFLTTVAAQITTFPILVIQFDRVSLIAPLANVAVVSFMPLAMLFGFLALVVSCVWFDFALLVAYVAWFFLKMILLIAHVLAQVPWSSFSVG